MKNSWKRFVCAILVLAMALAMSTPSVSQAAKKKAPKLNKKKVTLTVGKTVKLKVKNTKKKIKWSSSKKSVATVTKKGKVKAKKAGKTTITAKIGKKKLKCKVTVTAKKTTVKTTPTSKPTQKPSSSGTGQTQAQSIIASVVYENGQNLTVTLKKAQKLTANNFVVKTKKYANGTYNRQLKIESISTEDNITYKILIHENYNINYGEYVQVTVTDTTVVISSKEAVAVKLDEQESKLRYSISTSDEVSKSIYLSGYGYATIISADLPKGLKYESKIDSWGDIYLDITGTPTEAGKFQKNIVYKDELGNKFTEKITWLVGSEDVIVADCDETYHTYKNSTIDADNDFYVVGGSGNYTYNVISSDVTVDTDSKCLSKTFDKADTYEMLVEIVDANNPEVKTTLTWVAKVAQARKLSINVLDAKGQAIEEETCTVEANAKDGDTPYENRDWDSTYSYSSLTIWAIDGLWDIKVTINGYEYTLKNYEVKGNDEEFEIRMPLYKITLPEMEDDLEDFDWYDGKEVKGSGTSFYAPVGAISYSTISQADITNLVYRLTCNVSATAEENVAVVTKSEETAVHGTINVNTPVSLDLTYPYYKYYEFVPTETATYKFYSAASSSDADTCGKLVDSDLSFTETDDDGNGNRQFLITKECEAGKTYYIGVRGYSDNHIGKPVVLKVGKIEVTE